jgi:hypothetical protein
LLNRWGDFSRAQPDPVNDTDYWTVQEATNSAAQWVTAWAQVPAAAQNGNFADDYSHFGTGNGDCSAFSTPADTRFFALLFNGSLVGESLSPTLADPNTGRLPCTCQ